MAQSQLTKIARERSQLDMQMLSRTSIQWLRTKVNSLQGVSRIPGQIKKEQSRYADSFKVGRLYFFSYNPKHEATLPYYDQFPLVLILKKEGNSFLGLNLHYLPIKYRIAFLDKLLDLAVYKGDNEIDRIRVSYDILAASARYKEFKPCIKKYLLNHIESKILAIQPDEWEVATFMPIHQFKKEKAQQVWEDSVEQIKG